MPGGDLIREAQRQLTVCNSCRYCEGYCPVWPELSRRTGLAGGDLTYLANLCHDCQDCYTACMYTAPHEFDLNPPRVFSELREETYRTYRWPRGEPGWRALVGTFLGTGAVLLVLAYVTTGRGPAGSPYRILPHAVLLAVLAVPALAALAVLAAGAVRYWRTIHGPLRPLLRPRPWLATVAQAVQLRHQRGGGAGCDYPGDEPGRARRVWHILLVYGFGLCVLSTASAAVAQELLGALPPYPLLSVPVLSGTVGGLAMVAGGTGLLVLKARSDPARGGVAMRRADYGLLWALLLLAATGLLTLALRGGPLFAPVFLAHLDAVVVAFGISPYTKFPHWVYRVLAIHKYNLGTRP